MQAHQGEYGRWGIAELNPDNRVKDWIVLPRFDREISKSAVRVLLDAREASYYHNRIIYLVSGVGIGSHDRPYVQGNRWGVDVLDSADPQKSIWLIKDCHPIKFADMWAKKFNDLHKLVVSVQGDFTKISDQIASIMGNNDE